MCNYVQSFYGVREHVSTYENRHLAIAAPMPTQAWEGDSEWTMHVSVKTLIFEKYIFLF